MKPVNKRASKCHMELYEYKRGKKNDRRRIARKFWRRQASKALRRALGETQ